MKRLSLLVVLILILCVAIIFLIKNSDYMFRQYDFYRAKKISEKRHDILMKKITNNEPFTSQEVSELSAYYHLSSKFDEGIGILEKMPNMKNNSQSIYNNLSGLYARKAMAIKDRNEKKRLVKKSIEYINKGFSNATEKPLAYYLRGKVYTILGCMNIALNDFDKAIEEAKKSNIVLFDEGIYIDKQKFIKIVDDDIVRYKQIKDHCSLDN